jgi:hypothetical protein
VIPTNHDTTTRQTRERETPEPFRSFVFSWFRVVRGRRVEVIGGSILALVFLTFHLFYLPASLEDLDSINFALGVRHFDVAEHQPHPPGYPLFILAAKGAHALIGSEAHALAAVSVVAGAFGVLAIAALFRVWDGFPPSRKASADHRRLGGGGQTVPGSDAWSIASTALAITCPLYWFMAARPLSDVMGLAAAIAVQAMILSATNARALVAASFCAALAAGIRSQAVWMTVPLLIVKTLHHGGHRGHGNKNSSPKDLFSASPVAERASVALSYAIGILVWAIPLVALSGGPRAYWRAFFSQGAEDLSGIQMLWTRPNVRTLIDALYYTLVAPWVMWWIAAVVLVFALAGAVALLRWQRDALVALAVAFGPYFVFDLLFQETFTGRYALPVVIPVAFLVAIAARRLPTPIGLGFVVVLSMYCAHLGGTSVAALAREPAPAFRLLDDLREAARSSPAPPVLAMDRREEFDLRRPIKWVGDRMPAVAQKLPSPAQHEWLEVVKYWNGGGRAPVWFVADPLRTDVDLFQHPLPVTYRWPVPYTVLLSGVRPNEMDWYRLVRPEWYVGQGWAITPEANGVSNIDHRGLTSGDIEAWIARDALGGSIVIGGRNFDSAARPTITVAVDGTPLEQWAVSPGFFVRLAALPPADSRSTADYAKLTVRATPPSRVAIEQFDASAVRPLFGFGDGWNEHEYNPQTGLRWHWLTEKGELKVRSRVPALRLHLEGESPRKYFSRASRLVVRAGGQIAFDQTLSSDFWLDIAIPNAGDTITLETDQFFVPADRSRPWRKSSDRRHLGLRIFKVGLQ